MGRRMMVTTAMLVGALLCAAVAMAAVPTLVTYGPDGQRAQRPSTIFLSADAGPEFIHIHWTGWGSARSVGRGTLEQGQTDGGGTSPATLTLTGLRLCRGGANRTYSRGVLSTVLKGKRRIIHFPSYAPIAYCR